MKYCINFCHIRKEEQIDFNILLNQEENVYEFIIF